MKHRLVFCLFILFNFPSFGQAPDKLSYLALGDSYTIGESVDESERWPNILVDSLAARGYSIDDAIIIAKTGWRTDELIDTLQKRQDLKQFDIVSLLIGVNNQYQGKDLEEFEEEFYVLLQIAMSYSNIGAEGVFVMSIPDYGVTPFAASKNPAEISQEIKLYNAISREICEQNNILFIDITPISKEAKASENLLAEDGLHPSSLMYKRWVSHALSQLKIIY